MTSIGELFPKCRKLAYDARQQLAMVQQQLASSSLSSSTPSSYMSAVHGTAATSSGTTSVVSVTELFLTIEELNRQLDGMEQLALRENPVSKRQTWKHKITELRNEAITLQQQGQAVAVRWQQRMGGLGNSSGSSASSNTYHREREELLVLRRRRQRGGMMGGDEEEMQNLADEGQSLAQSRTAVLGLIAQGEASLTGLVDQRQRLRGVRRVLADMSSALGLTQSTMRIIERRDITDAYFVAGGMVVTLLVIYFVWF